jgi:hypothetical protein
VKRGELRQLAKLGVPLISDEVFADYTFAPDNRASLDIGGCG